MQPRLIESKRNKSAWLACRILVCAVFLSSGLAKTLDFGGGIAEMTAAGLAPAWLYNIVVAATLLIGCSLILLDKFIWVGSTVLAIFLVLTIPVVYPFWQQQELQANASFIATLTHLSLIGGLLAVSFASHYRKQITTAG